MVDQRKRTENILLVQKQLKDSPIFAPGLPSALIIEPGAVCPLKCPCCPQSRQGFDLTRQFFQLGAYKRVIDYFRDYADSVLLFNWGEPLLHPRLPEMISYASRNQMRSVVHSNLNFLNPRLAERLLKSGLSELVASIDGASEDSYSLYRKGGSFRLAIDNLKYLVRRREKLGGKTPEIIWKYLVFRHNQWEIEQARAMALDIGVSIDFKLAVAPGELEPTLAGYDNQDLVNKFIAAYGLPCEQLWKAPVICPDGNILPCCMAERSQHIVGNLFRQDFRDIWNGEKYQALRRAVKGEASIPDGGLVCRDCMFYRPAARERQLSLRAGKAF